MSKILEVKKIVLEFLKENIQCHEISIVKLNKGAESWEAIAEVYEDDSFLKSMDLPPKKKRVFYTVKVDDTNEVTAYERFTEYPATDE
ncbi:MAG: gas vesicle protein [Bacteroidales bacterium]|nr:gas vesicle protein [Bacteroidales bacterium]MCF8345453.1 gas vesicle protein [Bacteroidales bacterium]MCF8350145.1 gas vesicle protein [Bacteroidales bacterium]